MTKELIEKIEDAHRRVRKIGPDAIYETELREVLRAAADALSARQPSEDGEYILKLIETIKETGGSVEIHGVKILPCDEFGRTAAVPDAATEQVEAAAKALHETRNPWFAAYGDWGAAGFEIKQAFRDSARAALLAAAPIQQPVLDPEKVAEVLGAHQCSYGDCHCGWAPTIGDDALPNHQARALCEAAKRGELSA